MKLFLLIIFIILAISVESQNLNLQECIDYALQNRREIRRTENNIIFSEHNLKYSKYNLLPSINFEAGHNFTGAKDFVEKNGEYVTSQTGSYSINSQLVVFDGMQSVLKIKQSALLNERNITELDVIKNDIKIDVIHSYYELLLALQNKNIIANAQESTKKQMQIILEMVNEGKISLIDLYEIQAQHQKDSKNMLQTELNIKKAHISLKRAINYPLELDLNIPEFIEIEIEIDYNNLSILDAYKLALESFPQIRIAKQDSIYAKNNISLVKGQYFPYLTTTASMYSSYSENAVNSFGKSVYNFDNQLKDNIAHRVGLSLVIPIYSRHSIKQKVLEFRNQFENTILEKDILEFKLYREIETLSETIELQKKKIHVLEDEFNLYTKIYEMRTEQYILGVLSINDYLFSEGKKVNSELELNIEKYTLLLNMQLLNLYLGKI